MKKNIIFVLLVVSILFVNINGVKAVPNTSTDDGGSSNNGACTYGIICQYEFCSDTSITNCDFNYQKAIAQVAFRCDGTDSTASACNKFTSQQGACKANGAGEGSAMKINFSVNNVGSEALSGDAVYCYENSLDQNDLLDNDKYNKCLSETASIPANTFMNYFKKNGYKCPPLKISGSGNNFSGNYSSSGSGVIYGVSVGCVSRGNQNLSLEENACKVADDLVEDAVHQQIEDVQDATGTNGETVNIQNIKDWAANAGYDIDSLGDPCTIISPSLQKILSSAFWFISVAGIILVVVMTAVSFIKAITGSDDEKFRDAIKHLYTRIIVVIILLLLPMLLTFIVDLINRTAGEGEVSIGNNGEIFCDVDGSADGISGDSSE